MAEPYETYLHEDVLLLAFRGKGRADARSLHPYALGGAVLAELLLHERVVIEPGRWHRRVRVLSPTQIGEPILDSGLERIRAARRPSAPATWVGRLARVATTKAVARRLHRSGILRLESRRYLLMFTLAAYPERDSRIARRPVETLREVIFDGRSADERTRALVALAWRADLLEPVFGKAEMKERRGRLEELTAGQAAAEATRTALRLKQLAIAIGAAGGAIIAGLIGA
jgi:hypothetical protein